MSTIPNPRQARARLAGSTRWGASPETLQDAQRDLAAAHIAKAIREQVAKAPPLTDAQKNELASILLAPAGPA